MIIVTLTKLFVTRIVANVRSLSSLNFSIHASLGFFSGSMSLISDGERLKKAISEPLAKADTQSNNTAKHAAKTTPKDGSLK